jgi:hypothetical protein
VGSDPEERRVEPRGHKRVVAGKGQKGHCTSCGKSIAQRSNSEFDEAPLCKGCADRSQVGLTSSYYSPVDLAPPPPPRRTFDELFRPLGFSSRKG